MYWILPKFIFKFNFWSAILVRPFFISRCWIHRFIIKHIKNRWKKYQPTSQVGFAEFNNTADNRANIGGTIIGAPIVGQ